MRRRSKLCRFRFEDLETLRNGKAALLLRFSKTDQTGLGKLIPISNELQARADLDLDGPLSGHSFRVGAALDMLDAGEPIESIMLRGGWETESSVIRYLRAWQPAFIE